MISTATGDHAADFCVSQSAVVPVRAILTRPCGSIGCRPKPADLVGDLPRFRVFYYDTTERDGKCMSHARCGAGPGTGATRHPQSASCLWCTRMPGGSPRRTVSTRTAPRAPEIQLACAATAATEAGGEVAAACGWAPAPVPQMGSSGARSPAPGDAWPAATGLTMSRLAAGCTGGG